MQPWLQNSLWDSLQLHQQRNVQNLRFFMPFYRATTRSLSFHILLTFYFQVYILGFEPACPPGLGLG